MYNPVLGVWLPRWIFCLRSVKEWRMKNKGQSYSQLDGQRYWMKKATDGVHNSLIKSQYSIKIEKIILSYRNLQSNSTCICIWMAILSDIY